MKTQNETKTELVLYKEHAQKTKKYLNAFRHNNTKLFETIQTAYDQLYEKRESGKRLEWNRYKLEFQLVCDKWTRNEIVEEFEKLNKALDVLESIGSFFEDEATESVESDDVEDAVSEQEVA